MLMLVRGGRRARGGGEGGSRVGGGGVGGGRGWRGVGGVGGGGGGRGGVIRPPPGGSKGRIMGQSLAELAGLLPLLLDAGGVFEEGGQLLRFVPHIHPLVLSVLVHELELLQGADLMNVPLNPIDRLLRAVLDQIVEEGEGLDHVTPVLAGVVHALEGHVEDLLEEGGAGGGEGDLLEEGGRGAPRVV